MIRFERESRLVLTGFHPWTISIHRWVCWKVSAHYNLLLCTMFPDITFYLQENFPDERYFTKESGFEFTKSISLKESWYKPHQYLYVVLKYSTFDWIYLRRQPDFSGNVKLKKPNTWLLFSWKYGTSKNEKITTMETSNICRL